MIFNSLTFVVFLVIVVVLYWLLPRMPRLLMLFVASIVFYGFWRFDFVLLLLASIAFDYFIGLMLGAMEKPAWRKALLMASIASNILVLVFFKYTIFIVGSINSLFEAFGVKTVPLAFEIILPLGISFYIFQSLGYVVDVFRREIKAERSFLLFANFVIFFPQLIAGPILRASEVIWQLDTRPRFQLADVAAGLERIFMGLFLKVVLADQIGEYVDGGFGGTLASYGGFDAWTLAFLFGFQIYFDFSAYSHIALGSARLCGIRFPENFNFPYISRSPREFWKRWHISLSSWIRDYLYLPLRAMRGGSESRGGLGSAIEASRGRNDWALISTWAIMGLWHGANWTFLAWGLWHAGLILLFRWAERQFGWRGESPLTWFLTLPLVMLGWIFFRAKDLGDAFLLIGKALTPSSFLPKTGEGLALMAKLGLSLPLNAYLFALLCLLANLLVWLVYARGVPVLRQTGRGLYFGGKTVVFSVVIGLAFVYFRPAQLFIYFQF